MLPSRRQFIYFGRAIRCFFTALLVMAATWIGLVAGAIVAGVTPQQGAMPAMIAGVVMLFIGVPWLAADLIAELGPFPQRTAPLPVRLRLRLRRLRRATLLNRAKNRHERRTERVADLAQRAAARLALTTSTAPTRLDEMLVDDLTGVATASTERRVRFVRDYRRALRRLHAGAFHLDLDRLTPAARLLFLPVLIGDGRQSEWLDVAKSDFSRHHYVFAGSGHAVDIGAWTRQLATIDALLGGRFRVSPLDGISLSLDRLADLPDSFAMTADLLAAGALFLGRDLVTGDPRHIQLRELTHTLVVGPSGFGKSTLLHQMVSQLAGMPDQIAALHLVDLKHGLEFAAYVNRTPSLSVIERYDQLPALLTDLNATLDLRIAKMKAERLVAWNGAPIVVVIDEFAQIMLEPDSEAGRKAIVNGFVRLGNQARAAGIHLWVQVQHAVADTLPTALRRNLAATISFRQPTGQAAAMIFGDAQDLPADITRLRQGQFIYRNGRTSETTALQGALVTAGEIERRPP